MNFQESETCAVLMRAYAGECQSHTRYLLAAKEATAQNLPVLRQVFEYTAKQEMIHAQLFAKQLQQQGIAEIQVSAAFPLDPEHDLLKMLQNAQMNEQKEAAEVYASFADTAAHEEQQQTAALFRQIAAIEQSHAERFAQFAVWMQEGRLFCDSRQTVWLCMNCGHIHEGTEPPQNCPVCGAVQGFSVRRGFAPFTV
ncbi:MAG: rubrerythrin family protein [Oscillospiraceae bacterium]|nr:rubrerythrin family protein [Oscillospiraceae bacterium]